MLHEVYGHIIEVWEPRWRDKRALIGRQHVMDGPNYITFTQAESLKDKVYRVEGSVIRSYPLQANGRGEVYCVPMDKLKLIGHLTDKKAPDLKLDNSIIAGHLQTIGFTIITQDSDIDEFYVQAKLGNIMITVNEGAVYFDRFIRNQNGRGFGFEEIEYVHPWNTLDDLKGLRTLAQALERESNTIAESSEATAINPLNL